ncbi:MAG: TIGR03620 family F420-dependent LLM class oxidoreductase [Candidatus Limnocylindrales bacterium]|jgi:probable F420-dependent oxidoreductase
MSLARLHGIDPGRIGVFAGPLNSQPTALQREFVREMERLGYGTLWYGEALAQEAFARGAVYLAATDRLVVASGIANIWARDAAAMANGGRTLAEAWPGRFILGIGVSHPLQVRMRGHEYERPYSAMRAYLDAMDAAPWRGPEAELPPIVLAALGPKMVGLAGERTAGAYPYFTTTDHVREVRSILGPEPFLAADLPVVLAEDLTAARAIGDRHLSYYMGSVNYRNNLLRIGWPEADLEAPGSDALFEAIVAWGDLDRIGDKVRQRFEAGADQVVLNLVAADASTPPLAELRLLAPLTRGS